jgi:hypothetical protein
MLFALLTHWPGQFHKFRHFKPYLLLNDFTERYVSRPQTAGIKN